MASDTISYTFNVLNADGTLYGRGCFSHAQAVADIAINHGVGRAGQGSGLRSFWYSDPVVGTLGLESVLALHFSTVTGAARFTFNAWSAPEGSHGLTTGVATPERAGNVSAHRGGFDVDDSCQARVVSWPVLGEDTVEIIEADDIVVPVVDLVVVIDSSVSMKDEATALSDAVAAAIEAARSSCPSDLRVTYLGIEGTFKGTRFDRTIRSYMTGTVMVADADLRGRKFGTVVGGGAQEDGARAIEDVATHFDWRAGAGRAIFFLGDESLDGGNEGGKQDAGDIEAANLAIAVADRLGVRVHTYLGTSGVKDKVKREIAAEFARVAASTGGQAFVAGDALSGFQAVLQKVICGSKPLPRKVVHAFECCRACVERS